MRFILLLAALLQINVQPEYYHVFFENSLIPDSWYYSSVKAYGGSQVNNLNGRLPVTDEEYLTGPNALLLQTTDATEGEWEVSLTFPDWRGKDRLNESKMLSLYVKAGENAAMDDFPYIALGESDWIDPKGWFGKGPDGFAFLNITLDRFAEKGLKYDATADIKTIRFKQKENDGKNRTFFIDQVELVDTEFKAGDKTRLNASLKSYERHVDVFWNSAEVGEARYVALYRSEDGGRHFKQVAIQNPKMGVITDYHGMPGKKLQYKLARLNDAYVVAGEASKVMKAKGKTMTDEELLLMLQEASIRYNWQGAEPISGMALENKPGRRHMVATGASGWRILAIIAGVEEGLIPRKDAAERLEKIVTFLEKAETFHGAYPHFIDATTGKVEPFFGHRDNGADLVETSFLFTGLLTARNYFTQGTEKERIADRITKLWERIEWDWFRRYPDSPYLYWHWSPDQEWVINHKLIGWNESMITYLLAIASPTHGVPAEMYYTGWASQSDYAKEYRSGWGETHDGENYTNGNTYYGIPLEVGVNCGGPLFFTHFGFMALDPHGLKDKYCFDYYENLKNITRINYLYCLDNPNKRVGYAPDCWGLNVCENPWGSYGAYEAMPHHEDGTMSPSGALGAFPYMPEEAMTALRNYYRNYGKWLWGEFGFYDSFHLGENWTSNIWMGLNQGTIPVMIENYRSGAIWKYFGMDKDVKRMRETVFE